MSRLRLVLMVPALMVLGLAVGSTISEHHREQTERSAHFWSSVTYRGAQIEAFHEAEEMFLASDLVVVGRIVSMVPGRVLGDPGAGDAAHYLTGKLEVEEVIRGQSGADAELAALTLEVFTFDADHVVSLAESFPTERALFFLRNKGTTAAKLGWSDEVVVAESKYHRLIATSGLIRDLAGGPSPIVPLEDRMLGLSGATFDDVVRTVKALRLQGGSAP